MRSPKRTGTLKPPFLKGLSLRAETVEDWNRHPFSMPIFAERRLDIEFRNAVTVIVGPNGAGKSTLLEAIADQAGFGAQGGSRNHSIASTERSILSHHLRLSWLPKVGKGFFVRAETLFAFNQHIDALARDTGDSIYQAYGGRSLNERSHGEAFLALFQHRLGGEGLFLLDEPEAALSPRRQLEFMKVIATLEEAGQAQLIIATHSPLIMAYPSADLLVLDGGIERQSFKETDHFAVLRDFYADPDRFIADLLR